MGKKGSGVIKGQVFFHGHYGKMSLKNQSPVMENKAFFGISLA